MLGQRRVLVPLGLVHAAALGAIVAGAEAGAPVGGARRLRLRGRLRDPADLVGAALDVADAAARPPELMQAAYALDSVMIELIFVLGPLVTALVATALAPPAALVVSAVSVVMGTVAFTALPPSRAMRAQPTRASRRAGSARWLRRACARSCSPRCPPGIGIGICEVASPPSATPSGAAATAGMLLARVVDRQRGRRAVLRRLPNRPPLERVHIAVAGAAPAQPAAAGRRAVGRR